MSGRGQCLTLVSRQINRVLKQGLISTAQLLRDPLFYEIFYSLFFQIFIFFPLLSTRKENDRDQKLKEKNLQNELEEGKKRERLLEKNVKELQQFIEHFRQQQG